MLRKVFSIIATAAFAAFLLIPSTTQVDAAAQFDDTMNGMTIAKLPACTSTSSGSRATVTDFSGTATWGAATGAGGGSGHAGVFCDGASWKVYAGGGASSSPITAMSAPVVAGHTYTSQMLIAEDQFTSSTIDQTKWYNLMGQPAFTWNDNGRLPTPYTGVNCTTNTNTSCNNSFSTTYYDPFPYGANYTYNGNNVSIGSTTGNRMTGGVQGVGLGLSAIASNSKSGIGYTYASSAITGCGGASINGGVCKAMVIPATGGFIQIRAKLADARYGAWPSLWFLPASGTCPDGGSCEMDMQEGGTVDDVVCHTSAPDPCSNRELAMHWWGGNQGVPQQIQDTGKDLSADYHIYGIEYRPGVSWKVYLDGQLMFTWTNGMPSSGAVSFELIMDVEVYNNTVTGGPNPPNAGFHTYTDAANHPGPFTSLINDVQLYSLAP